MRTLLLSLCLLALPALAAEPRTLSWDDLIPADAPELVAPEVDHGGDEDGPAARQLGVGAPVVKALDRQHIRLPGYLVPLDVDASGKASQYLLVPWYGACIHVPPPPSNQIVQVDTTQGPPLDDLWLPFWVSGELRTETRRSELAETGYRMLDAHIEPYPLELLEQQ